MGMSHPRALTVVLLPVLGLLALAAFVWDNPLAPAQELRMSATQPTSQPATQPAPWQNVNVERFAALQQEKCIVVDVRTEAEFQDGHLAGAMHININDRNFVAKVGELDKGQTVLVYCASGYRSARACERMQRMGFARLYNLEEGIHAWKKAGKPVER